MQIRDSLPDIDINKAQLNWTLRQMEQSGHVMISDDIVYIT